MSEVVEFFGGPLDGSKTTVEDTRLRIASSADRVLVGDHSSRYYEWDAVRRKYVWQGESRRD